MVDTTRRSDDDDDKEDSKRTTGLSRTATPVVNGVVRPMCVLSTDDRLRRPHVDTIFFSRYILVSGPGFRKRYCLVIRPSKAQYLITVNSISYYDSLYFGRRAVES